jgi:hypothetical protein
MKILFVIGFIAICAIDKINLSEDSKKPIAVCQVLQNLQYYRGKVVKVRGNWNGIALSDDCNNLTAGNYKWENAIYLTPITGSKPAMKDLEFTIDMSKVYKAINELERLQPGPVNATILGKLDAKEKLEIFTQGAYQRIPLGFGPGGIYPAQIMLMEIIDIIGQPQERGPDLKVIPIEPLPPLKKQMQN